MISRIRFKRLFTWHEAYEFSFSFMLRHGGAWTWDFFETGALIATRRGKP